MARRKPMTELRGNKSFARRAGQRKPRSITLIVCEGETEQAYLEAARIHYGLTAAEVIVAPNAIGPAPISVVQCAERKCNEPGSYDKVFCVFDRDGHESFQRARTRIRGLANRRRSPLPISEAISVPCFEFWVLLHYEQTDAPFDNCDNVITRVRFCKPGYAKADALVARQLVVGMDMAIANALWVEHRAANNNYNPYTSVHHVIQHFAQVASEKVIA